MLRYPFAWGGVRLFKPGQKGFPVQLPLTPITKGTMDEETLIELLMQGEKVHQTLLLIRVSVSFEMDLTVSCDIERQEGRELTVV